MITKKQLLFLLASSFSSLLFVDYYEVSSERKFENRLHKYPLAVVCLGEQRSEDREERKELRQEFNRLEKIVRSASKTREYDNLLEKDVGFIVVDTSSKRADEVDDQYGVKKFPTCMLFKYGEPVRIDGSEYAQLYNPGSSYKILSFLRKYFNKELDKLLKDRKEEEAQEREERLARYEAYARWGGPYYGYGWGYPYYGWGYGRWGYRYGGYWC